MTQEEWNNLKEGQIIHNEIDGYMEVTYSSAFSDKNEKELCLVGHFVVDSLDKSCIWRGSQFDPKDWEIIENY